MAVSVKVMPGDCLAIIPELVASGIVVDAVVCDPPYHLLPTHKRFSAADAAPAQHGRDGAMARLSAGFMQSRWDGGDVAFRPETWATVASIMRPGAFLLAFGGTRTYHHLVCAIEDGGFVIQDCLMFLFGTGFPKRRDMLKPAFEPIVLAYKPGGKRTMQIDECRIGMSKDVPGSLSTTENRIYGKGLGGYRQDGTEGGHDPNLGRWPANCCHDGSEEVTEAFPETETHAKTQADYPTVSSLGFSPYQHDSGRTYEGDTGSAARFFYCAKADKQDRWGSRHPTVKPVELMKWLVPLVTPAGGLVLDPFAGSGTTGVAALATGRDCILIEREEQYIADIRERLAFYEGNGTHSVQAKNRSRVAAAGTLL